MTSVIAQTLLILDCCLKAVYFFRADGKESEALKGKKIARSGEENKSRKSPQ